ncbi:alpha/beta hydrolase [Sphingobium sufflavum]|uniref:alpha/beta hydrolase fold domain-containing protein n=1 Tax=Sphingobium sufflavum TaxID=1129547 RepID=UPI001F336979|nr:alpha/beta hydrolase fold domain-containing protein [Sphingobium sufflavum]MCE7796412.1 alpha/beta hydrolase [Sphingobium sufflavum]
MTGPRWPERTGRRPGADVAAIRSQTAAAIAAGRWHISPPPQSILLGGVRCLHFAAPDPQGTVLHFHGGGYRIGCAEMMTLFAIALVARCGVDVICPDYRLAPDHPFPAALNDGWSCWTALRESSALPILLSGDSAGGGLAATIAAHGLPLALVPAGVILLSPWIDLSVTSGCYDRNAATDPVFSRASAKASAEDYLQGYPADAPLACPLSVDLHGFAPSFISVGTGEVLADDALRLHAALLAVATPSTLSAIDGMEHVAVMRDRTGTGAQETFAAIARFIDDRLSPLAIR